MLITTQQPRHTGAMAAYEYPAPEIEKLFKFVTKYDEDVNLSYVENGLLMVPREAVPLGKADYRKAFPPIAINCNFQPRNDEQATLPYQSVELLQQGRNHVFKAPTGWGKSVAGGVIACKLGQPTAIIVNKTDLMKSWYDALVNVLKVPASQIGKVQQDTCDWQGKRIVIMMAHSICIPDRYPPEMYQNFGLIIVDEVDQIPTEFFGAVFKLFPAKYRLGMSATTDRKDGKWKSVIWNIGPVLVAGNVVPMQPKVLVKHTGWKIPRYKVWRHGELIEEPIPFQPGRMVHVIKAMAGSYPRNMQLVEFIQASYKAGRHTLVLSELIDDHLKPLFKLLAEHGIPGEHMGFYVGGMKEHEYERSKHCPVILGTYKMVDRGTNVPHWNTLVLATPRSDVRQAVGRVIRYVEGKKEPVVFDPVDADSIFQGFHRARLTQYYGIGAKIVKM